MKYLYLLLLCLTVWSCKTSERSSIGTSLLGVVYDSRSNAVQNASITIKDLMGREVTSSRTDINGKFYIDALPFDRYITVVKADRSKQITVEIDHYDIENVIIIRLERYDDMLLTLEESLKKQDWESADYYIRELEQIAPVDVMFNFLNAIYLIKTGNIDEARELLQPYRYKNYTYINKLLEDISE